VLFVARRELCFWILQDLGWKGFIGPFGMERVDDRIGEDCGDGHSTVSEQLCV
jgi:hypothetical protein